jgi:hypothetical protein
VYAKRSKCKAELINGTMDAADRLKNAQERVRRAGVSIVEGVEMCVDN